MFNVQLMTFSICPSAVSGKADNKFQVPKINDRKSNQTSILCKKKTFLGKIIKLFSTVRNSDTDFEFILKYSGERKKNSGKKIKTNCSAALKALEIKNDFCEKNLDLIN